LKLKAGLVRWRPRDVHPPGASLDKFWQDSEPTIQPDGSAKKLAGVFGGGGIGFDYVTAFSIEVAREDVEALLPPEPTSLRGAKRWVYELLEHHPDADAQWIWEQRPNDDVTLKTIQNLVSAFHSLPAGPSRSFPKPSEKIPGSSGKR
jgi:hypothetical protein